MESSILAYAWRRSSPAFAKGYGGRAPRVGALLLFLLAAAATVAPAVSPYMYDEVNLAAIQASPSWEHWMGTDELGRDLGTRVMIGARLSLVIGLAGALVAAGGGALAGALAGYYGGFVESFLMRAVDVALAMPLLPVLIVVSAFTRPSVPGLVILVAAFGWMETARLVRASFLSLKAREFIRAARAAGASDLRIVTRHLFPNALAPLLVSTAILVGRVIVIESVLSFLGLGVQPPVPSWGNMLYGAQATLGAAPWLAAFPGLFIFMTVLAVNLLAEGAREGSDPRLDNRGCPPNRFSR